MARRSIGILLDIALTGLVAAVVLTAAIGPVAALTGRHAAIIGGGSMTPAIPLGSMVIDGAVGGRPLRVGEIATFRTPAGVAVTHRVRRVIERADGTWFETKGDANAQPDPALWPASAVTGRVVASIPGAGYLSWLLRHPVGWLNVIVLAGWLVLARQLVRGAPRLSLEPAPAADDRAGTAPDATGRAGEASA